MQVETNSSMVNSKMESLFPNVHELEVYFCFSLGRRRYAYCGCEEKGTRLVGKLRGTENIKWLSNIYNYTLYSHMRPAALAKVICIEIYGGQVLRKLMKLC